MPTRPHGDASSSSPREARDARALAAACPFALAVVDHHARLALASSGHSTLLGWLRETLQERPARRRVAAAIGAALCGDVDEVVIEDAPGIAGPRAVAIVTRLGDPLHPSTGALIAVLEGSARAPFAARAAALARALEAHDPAGASQGTPRALPSARELLELSDDLLLAVDREGAVVDVSPAFLRRTGLASDDVVGRPVVDLVADETRRELAAALPALRELRTLDGLAVLLRRAQGKPVPLTARVEARHDERGRFAGALVVLRDAASSFALRRRLLAADRLSTAGRLAAGIAHGLNNPLQAIFMHLALLEGSLPDDDIGALDSWRRIREGALRMQRMVAELFDVEGSAGHEARDENATERVVRESLALAVKPLRAQGVGVEIDVAADLPALAVAPHVVQQVLLGVFLHAIAAMRTENTVRVTARSVRGGEAVAVTIHLRGPALAEDEFLRLVDPFASGDAAVSDLGLSATWTLLQECGGELTLDAVLGSGTRVRVLLPVADARARAVSERATRANEGVA